MYKKLVDLSEEKVRITLQIWQDVLGTNFQTAIFEQDMQSIVAKTSGHGTLTMEDGSKIEVTKLEMRFNPIIVLENGETKRRWEVPTILEVTPNGNGIGGEISYQICFNKIATMVNEVCPVCQVIPNIPCKKCGGRGVIPTLIIRVKP